MNNHYKVFISFKNTDDKGNVLNEVDHAQKIYSKLTDAGISTFYSNASLLEFGESAYTDAIDAAIDEAMVMIVIASDLEYITEKWIKYEWSNFHAEITSGTKENGILLPYFSKSIPRTARPMPLRNVESFDLEDNRDDDVAQFVINYLKTHDTSFERKSEKINFAALGSTYNAGLETEFTRLRIQAENTRAADMPAIEYCLAHLNKSIVNILDVGCSYGFVSEDRFGNLDTQKYKFVGIDYNQKCIDFAKQNNQKPHFFYHTVNIEAQTLEADLQAIMQQRGIDSFDLVNMTLVLHHLKDPVKFLRRLRKFLSNDAFIIIRGSDDGSAVAFNDEGLVKKIIDKHMATPGISDRLNGRKIPYQLSASGFYNIKSFSYIKDITGMDYDKRQEIFDERFAYRINYIKNLVAMEPTNMVLKNDMEWMAFALDQLSNKFGDPSFWYQEVDFVFVATKNPGQASEI